MPNSANATPPDSPAPPQTVTWYQHKRTRKLTAYAPGSIIVQPSGRVYQVDAQGGWRRCYIDVADFGIDINTIKEQVVLTRGQEEV